MILADTSIWIDHLHRTDPALVEALDAADVSHHPMVVGELALGRLRDRGRVLGLLTQLPRVRVASHDEMMSLVEARVLYGQGLSVVDAHLLASALLTPGTHLWTRDRRLRSAAETLAISYPRP